MKVWNCIRVKHHDLVSETIKGEQHKGWKLHTYTTGYGGTAGFANVVNHYLLFQRDEQDP